MDFSPYPLFPLSAFPLIRFSPYPLFPLSALPLIRSSPYPLFAACALTDKCFLNIQTHERLNINDLWLKVMPEFDQTIFGELPLTVEVTNKTVVVSKDFLSTYRFIWEEERLQIDTLEFEAAVRRWPSKLQLESATKYGEINDPHTTVARWVGKNEPLSDITIVLQRLPPKESE